MGHGQKRTTLVCRCHQLLSGFLANGEFPRVSHQSRLSANDKGYNELNSGSVYRSLDIYLTAAENPGKFQLGVRLLKTMGPYIASSGSLTFK